MTKEFHAFTFEKKTHEQGFVFEVERDSETNDVNILELWIITMQESGEVKTRINFDQVIHSIIHNPGGNVPDEQIHTILDIFDDVLNKYKKQQLHIDLAQKELIETSNDDTELLINASIKADKHIETENKEISDLVKSMLSK
jgi:hypothetical protein